MMRAVLGLLALSLTVSPIERSIAPCGIEIGVGYDRAGREVWRTAGDEWQPGVTFDQEGQIIQGSFTHSHLDYCSLSPEDVRWAAGLELSEIRAVFIRQGRIGVAVLRNPRAIYALPDGAIEAANRRFFKRDDCAEWDATWRLLKAQYGLDYEVLR